MQTKRSKIDRRNFLKTAGAAGLGSVLVGCKAKKEPRPGAEPNAVEPPVVETPQQDKFPQVPKRLLGKTGIEVPVLSLGTMFNLVDSQIILRSTLW